MSICWPSDSGVNFFDDDTPGPQGVEGWWSDNIFPNRRIFWFNGTWWQKDKKLPFWGYKDIYIDAFFFPNRIKWLKGGWAHSGFLLYANKAYELLKDKLLETENPIIMGHSLGGAMAQLIALRYCIETGKSCDCYVGGGPTALGNSVVKKEFSKRLPKAINFRNGFDIVTYLHCFSWLVGLGPMQTIHTINLGTLKERVTEKGFFKRIKQAILLPFTDHFIDRYDIILDKFIRT